jgi:hypothetical protein
MPVCISIIINWRWLFSLTVIAVFSGCNPIPQPEATIQHTQIPTQSSAVRTPIAPSSSNIPSQTTEIPSEIFFGFTYQKPDGNRVVPGTGNLPNQTPMEIKLSGKPIWIVGTPFQNEVLWSVVLEDGRTVSYLTSEQGVVETSSKPSALPPGMPPLLVSSSDQYSLIIAPVEDQSPLTHPNYLPQSDQRAYITKNGDLKFIDSADRLVTILDVNALPDARILSDEQDRLLLLSGPTGKYSHGVLGDNIEASSLTIIETQPEPRIISVISLPENEVIEGISPIWVDINGDGQREIIVTVSDLDLGAGIVIFSETGERLAEGPKMGRAYRWRHQIGYESLGPNGESELLVVRTPHIGGVVEYYQYSRGDLTIAAEFAGITSHTIGSRNLDMAALGDFDGDGLNELLLPNPDLTELVAVRRTPSGAEQAWQIAIGGEISTNLSGVTLPNGKIALAVGRNDSELTVWIP